MNVINACDSVILKSNMTIANQYSLPLEGLLFHTEAKSLKFLSCLSCSLMLLHKPGSFEETLSCFFCKHYYMHSIQMLPFFRTASFHTIS